VTRFGNTITSAELMSSIFGCFDEPEFIPRGPGGSPVPPMPPRGQRRAEHRGRRWVKGETLKPETGKTRNNGTKVIREFRERTPIFFDHTRKTENRKRKYKGMKTFTRIARINRELFLTAHKHRWTRIFEQRMFNRREPRERRPLPKAESGKRRTEIQLPRKGTKGT